MASIAAHEKKLKEIFNINSFYDQQWKTIDQLFKEKRVLLIEKTGFGKSLCFQYPATQFDGVSIVFSPLIALMRDQIKYLKSIGIKAECINSEQDDNKQIINNAIKGEYKILYIAPERLQSALWNESVKQMKVKMIVIDEAHCISVWGHDFRPDYRRIINIVQLMPENLPILATTATATKRVQKDIQKQMGSKCVAIRGDLLRDNFNLKVLTAERMESKMIYIKNYLDSKDGNGIIYVGTRSKADIISQWLNASGIPSTSYHAGIEKKERKEIENGLMDNKWKCVVSTNALGMGMDKPDLRFIIHEQIPQSPIHYYQEIGRGGRDGKETDLILLYIKSDKELIHALIKKGKPSTDQYNLVINLIKQSPQGEMDIIKQTNLTQAQVRTIFADLVDQGVCKKDGSTRKLSYVFGKEYASTDNEQLRKLKLKEFDLMIDYTKLETCRMKYLCNYLGDETNSKCGKCDVCKDSVEESKINKTELAEVNKFLESNYPVLPVSLNSDVIKDGYAYSYYGTTKIGSMINKCKYQEGGDFPETLVNGVKIVFNKKLKENNFDLMFFVPPTESGDLVKNFAQELSKKINVPVSDGLVKISTTEPQKVFASGHRKIHNVRGKFSLKNNVKVAGKNILIIDDVYDSGSTIKEICKLMKNNNASLVAPLVIAKTLGG